MTLAIRVLWALFAPRHARFLDLVTGPGRIPGYLRDLFMGGAERDIERCPAGGAMTFALLFALVLTALSGMTNPAVEEGQGPLAWIVTAKSLPASMAEEDDDGAHKPGSHRESSDTFDEIHKVAAHATRLLILLHLLGTFQASRAHGENLVRGMFKGRKRRDG